MGAVLIRGIDEELKSKLRLRAAKHGVSMEQEVRTILDHELNVEPSPGDEHPVRAIRRYVEEHGGWDDMKFVRIRSKARAPKFDGGAQVDRSGYKCGFGNRQAAAVRAGDELALPKAGTALYITSVTEAEIRYGISLVSTGKRRAVLQQFAHEVLDRSFGVRNLPFDSDAAKRYALIASSQKLAGMSVSVPDAKIAAIAASKGFMVATRNEKHFLHSGVRVVNGSHKAGNTSKPGWMAGLRILQSKWQNH
jgi:predicted nucleic acid-binding protein/plasmid stability protein